MEYTIVPMTAAHLDQVEEIEKSCFADPWSRQIFEETLMDLNTVNWAAQAPDGTVLGYISFTVVLDEADVNNLAVRPDCRRQGVASALLAALGRHGRARDLARLFLEVRLSNKNALMLYKKFGYTEVGRRKNYYLFPREDAIIMKLELGNAPGSTVP